MERIALFARVAMTGLLALAVVAPALGAQGTGMGRQGRMMGHPGSVPGVQLTADQQRQIAIIRQSTERQVQSIRQDRMLSAQQKDQRIVQARQLGHERVLNILTPEQRRQFAANYQERSRVAGFRGRGGDAGRMPGAVSTIVPGVQLTQEQQQRVVEIRRNLMERIQEIRGDMNLTAQQKESRIADARRRAHDQVMNVLTPEQREQFRQWWENRQKGS